MKRVFLSLPMSGRTDEECITTINNAMRDLKTKYPNEEFDFVHTFYTKDSIPSYVPQNLDGNKLSVWQLGYALQQISGCDAIYFAGDVTKSRGCMFEYTVAMIYELEII